MALDGERALSGRVAIVTGGSRGIGGGVTSALAARGAAVTIAARTVEPEGSRLPGSLHEVVEAIRSAGGTALAVRCDVADPADADRLVVTSRREFGAADILVNNAALTVPDRPAAPAAPSNRSVDPRSRMSILSFALRAYRRAFEVNLSGPYELSRLVLHQTPGTTFSAGGRLGDTLAMDRFVAAVLYLCAVPPSERAGALLYSEDVLDQSGRRRGGLGERYL